MSLWRQLTHGLRGLTRRAKKDREVDEEVQHYFEEAAAAWRSRGLSAEDARKVARLELGNMTVVEEQVRSYGWENMVRTFFSDVRFAARQLRNHPGFTVVNILTLALGIGASTAIFSAVNPILFEPLPYPHPGRILMIWSTSQGERSEVAFGTYRELKERSRAFDEMAIFEPWQPAMTGGTQPERIEGQSVSAGFFRVLGVSPILGRDFRSSEDVFNGPKVVILSDKLWQRLFHGDLRSLAEQSNWTTTTIPSLVSCLEISMTSSHPQPRYGHLRSMTWADGQRLQQLGMGQSPALGGPPQARRKPPAGHSGVGPDSAHAMAAVPASTLGLPPTRTDCRFAAGRYCPHS